MGLISRVSSRTYRFLTKNPKKRSKMVKSINCVESVSLEDFGPEVKLIVKGQCVTVIGPRGTLKKDLSHLKVEFKKNRRSICPNLQMVGHQTRCFCPQNHHLPHPKHGCRCHLWFPIQNANRLRAFPHQHGHPKCW